MNCQEALANLLASESPAEPAAEVERHLADCPRCRQRQRRLVLLDQELADLPRPGESPEARLRLLERLGGGEPGRPVIPLPIDQPARKRRWWIAGRVGAAACLLAAVALGYGLRSARDAPSALVEQPGPAPIESQESLVAALLDSDLRLARLTTAAEQLATLADMAGRLQHEAIRAARQGQEEDVAYLRGLYEQVVARGLAGRARGLPETQRHQLARLLHEEGAAAEAAAQQVAPPAGRHLQAMHRIAVETAAGLLGGPPAPPVLPLEAPPGRSPAQALVSALVLNGVRLAESEDPLRRADVCTDIADSLVHSIREASTAGDSRSASTWSQHVGEVVSRGVAGNLVLVEETDGPRQTERDRVLQRASQAATALEGVLERVPAPARAAVQKALEASRQGLQKGKGSGPPGKGKDFVPPGKAKDFVPPGLKMLKEIGKQKVLPDS